MIQPIDELSRSLSTLVIMSDYKEARLKAGGKLPPSFTSGLLDLKNKLIDMLKAVEKKDPKMVVELPVGAGIKAGTIKNLRLLSPAEWDAKYRGKGVETIGPAIPKLAGLGSLGILPVIPVAYVIITGIIALSAAATVTTYLFTAEGRKKQDAINAAEANVRGILEGINSGKIDPATGASLIGQTRATQETVAEQPTTFGEMKTLIIVGVVGVAAIMLLPKLMASAPKMIEAVKSARAPKAAPSAA